MRFYLYLICLVLCQSLHAQTASFTAPDTVCVGAPVTITDQSASVNTWQWNFCSGTSFQPPTVVNNGNPIGFFRSPDHSVIVEEGGWFIGFVTNTLTQRLMKLEYGTSLTNTPTPITVSQVNAVMPASASGIQAVEDGNGKHLIIISGKPAAAGNIIRVDFGNSWGNFATATATDWGNPGGLLNFCADLAIAKDNGRFYGFTMNQTSNSLVRLEFGTDFSAAPVAVNLGNFGGAFNLPDGLKLFREGTNWYGLLAAATGIHRLDFGNTLTNVPTITNLGNFGGMINTARDVAVYQDCAQTFALVASSGNNSIVRLNFAGGITGAVTAVSYGNPGNTLSTPSGISKLYRDGSDIRAIITNGDPANSGTAMLTMSGCTAPVAPIFQGQSPPPLTINTPGTYYINLVTDANTPAERFFCKPVVVLEKPVVELGQNDIVICNGTPVMLDAGAGALLRYTWTHGEDDRFVTVTTSGNYGVSVFNGGCTVTDAIRISITTPVLTTGTVQNIDCNHELGEVDLQLSGGTAPYTFRMNSGPVGTLPEFRNLAIGNYTVNIRDDNGCTGVYTFSIIRDMLRTLTTSAISTDLSCFGISNGTILAQVSQGASPLEFALNNGPFGSSPSFTSLAAGAYKVYIRNAYCLDSQEITLTQPDALLMPYVANQDTCNRLNGWVSLAPEGGTPPYSLTWNGNIINDPEIRDLGVGIYAAQTMDANGCRRQASIYVPNLNLGRMSILTPDTIIAIGDEFVIRAANAPDYIWGPIDQGNIACPVCPETPVRPMVPTQYIVRTLTGANCVSADTVRVMIDYSSMLAMPNAFSPNNDGVNDFFRPKSRAVMAFSMQVFNRSGNLVFTTNDHRKGWDGNFNGEPQPMGTYVYIIKFGFWQPDGKMETFDKKGTFDLIR